jgi:2-oxoglutarate dehydrogenase E2 component (dihydrolipoamide succinyltransferase)
MSTKVLVPRLGEGVEEVTVIKWLKREGDTVNELEALLEVNTDKVDTEIPAPASGTVLKILAQEGLPAKVGEVLAFIGQPGESVAGATSSAPEEQPVKSQAATGQPVSTGVARGSREEAFVSPVVAKIAAEHDVKLSQVPGTGLNGRITKNDVLRYVESSRHSAAGTQSAPVPEARAMPRLQGDELLKHTVIRRQIAEHMVLSHKTSPHVLTVMEADMSKVVAHRAANKDAFAREGVTLTITAYFMMAIAAGLKVNPMANSSWTAEGIHIHRAINLGMATSLGAEGLIVPVIKGAGSLSLLEMARAVNDLANRARTRKLQPNEVKGGTFTLTNHGISGSLMAFPIINQPQSGILGTGALQKRVVVIGDAIAIRPMVFLSYVFDHRILDGASADAFLMSVKSTLETWPER